MKIRIIATIVSFLFITSCSTQTFKVSPNIKREIPSGNPHFSKWSNFFLSGLGQSDFKDADAMCKESDGIAFLETRQSFVQGLVGVVTYGIYTPRTMNIYCNKN